MPWDGRLSSTLAAPGRPSPRPWCPVFLFERFGITSHDADIRIYEPQDFIVRFRHQEDRNRVLASGSTGPPLPLVWYPWRRTSAAVAGAFCYMVQIGMRRVPLHARNVPTAQAILGPSCARIEIVRPDDVPADDDREFFVTAWCWHPRYIPHRQIIFIPEPTVPGAAAEPEIALPGLRYVIRLRLIAYQDRQTPPSSQAGDDDDDAPDGGGDDHPGEDGPSGVVDGASDFNPTPRRDSDGMGSDDSNGSNYYNKFAPGGAVVRPRRRWGRRRALSRLGRYLARCSAGRRLEPAC